MKWYQFFKAKPDPKPPPIRMLIEDYRELTDTEQMYVEMYHRCEIPFSAVPLRGQVYLRRHYPDA